MNAHVNALLDSIVTKLPAAVVASLWQATAIVLYFNISATLPAVAHTQEDEDTSVNLIESLWNKDKKDSVTTSTTEPFTYQPRLRPDGVLDEFKILEGKNVIFTRSRSRVSSFEQFWPVHPIVKTVPPPKTNDEDRVLSQIVGVKGIRSPGPFVDINGDGKLELIVGSFSGGAHCCHSYKIYTLGANDARLIARIDGNDSQFVFADIDGDGKCEAVGYDFTFAYWNTSFAESPAPLVILKPEPSGYVLAIDLMRLAAPNEVQIKSMQLASEKFIRVETEAHKDSKADFALAPELWKNMLALIYAGHAKQCWELVDETWPMGKKALFMTGKAGTVQAKLGTKEEFIAAFLANLQKSPYAEGLKKLNAGDKRIESMPGTAGGR